MTDNSHHTHTRETRVEKSGGSPVMAFILGAVVVAVAALAWVIFGGDGAGMTSGAAEGGGDVSISIEDGSSGGTGGNEASASGGGEATADQ